MKHEEYVKRDDPDNPFKNHEATVTECKNCGQAILVAPGEPEFCNGKDATGCAT